MAGRTRAFLVSTLMVASLTVAFYCADDGEVRAAPPDEVNSEIIHPTHGDRINPDTGQLESVPANPPETGTAPRDTDRLEPSITASRQIALGAVAVAALAGAAVWIAKRRGRRT